jgi:NitT/TauT family transport system substrate-binding protein
LAFPGADFGFLPLFVIQEKGFFEEEGLNVETQNMRSNVSVPALLNRALDITTAGTSSVWAAQGAPFHAIMFYYTAPSMFLAVSPDIKDPQDLVGKALGISNPGSQEHIGTMRMLESLGVDPESVQFVALGEANTRFAAAMAGQIAGSAEDPDVAARLVKEGNFRVIASAAGTYNSPFSGWAVHNDYLESNRETVLAFLRASIKGLQFVHDNPQEAADIATWVLGTDNDIAREAAPLVAELIDPDDPGGITEDSLKAALEEIKTDNPDVSADVGLEDVYDFSLLREAQRQLGIECTDGWMCK